MLGNEKRMAMLGKIYVSKVLFACALLLSGVFAGRASAQGNLPLDALEGLDPVMLAQGKEAQGEMNITVTLGRFRYFFANAANKAAFEQDPERFEIQLNGSCARMGAPVRGIADLYAVHKGRIYIFGSANCKTLFVAAPEKFLESEDADSALAAATPEALKQGQALIDKAVAAMGGAAKIDGLASYRERSESPQTRGHGAEPIIEVKVNTDLLIVFPDRIRREQSMPDFHDRSVTMRQTLVMLPGEEFGLGPGGVFNVQKNFRDSEEKRIRRQPLFLLRARQQQGFKAVALGKGKFGEAEFERALVTWEGASYALGIDPATGRILSLSYKRRGQQGNFGEFVQTFSDFRDVDGLTLPFKVTATFDGHPWKDQSSTIETIVVNGAIDPALFEKPKQGQ
jgi:YHS domain-containing protein